MKKSLPELEIFEHCKCSDMDPPCLLELLKQALPLILDNPGKETLVLPELSKVEINIVPDETIAKVHGEFMDDPTPTDVITFHHGEIFVSSDTARSKAAENNLSPREEILLYMIHGLLHLNGHVDNTLPERTKMHQIQDSILAKVLS